MIIEPIIVRIIDEARIESDLLGRAYVGELRWALENPQIVVVLLPWHRGERTADGVPFCEKCGGGTLDERLHPRGFSAVVMAMQYN